MMTDGEYLSFSNCFFFARNGHCKESVAYCHDCGEAEKPADSEFHPYPTADGGGYNGDKVVD